MVRRDGAEVRRERIQQIVTCVLGLLHKKNGQIPLSETIALLQYEMGLTKPKLMEYLKIGEDTGHFIVEIEKNTIGKITEN